MLHCPVCGVPMREIERFGVLVDICPSCKGVWLDRGELDKIIQYAVSGYQDEVAPAHDPYGYVAPEPSLQPPSYLPQRPQPSYPQQTYPTQPSQPYPQQAPPTTHQQPPYPQHSPKRKKRFGEFLEELFDIFD